MDLFFFQKIEKEVVFVPFLFRLIYKIHQNTLIQLIISVLRRDRDSNPGYPRGYNGFRDRPDRPLRHLS